jgi:energy-coupling factor transporter ATP-binding protein EcfA2
MQEQLICPYPGLRPFNEDESIFFKGREEHIEQIVKQLEEKKFLMLTGASGDGKSSLVYAGVIPNARAGFFKAKFNNWIVADFRPEREPLTNMATAISTQLKLNDIPRVEKELSYGFSSLIDIYKSSSYWIDQNSEAYTQLSPEEQKKTKRKGANLLILVDQFEEFFTNPENYHNGRCSIESQAVINSLLETTRLAIEQDVPIYIVCTMRSDYIGQCASFRGLPEYIGYSQFFVPRLKRKEIYQVIEEPAQLNGNKISKRLVEMLINEMNDGIDQLPVLQHSLNQIWQKANSGQVEMDLIHFAKINGIPKNQLTLSDKTEFEIWFETLPEFKKEFFAHSSLGDVLDAHANELFETANAFSETITSEDAKLIITTAFKCLTKIDEARAVRNRMTLGEVTQIINQPHITNTIVAQVLYIFRIQGNTFLKPFIFDVTADAVELSDNSVLDITHESLIRNWKKLTDWAKEEYDNLLTWQDFNKQLDRWTNSNKSSGYLLPIGPLTFFENWYNIANPNKYWLARYDDRDVNKNKKLEDAEKTLANAQQFIKRSARRLFINRTVIKYGADKIIAVLGAFLLLGGCTYFYFDFRKKQNDYVVNDLQQKSKELLKSKYIKNKIKADYILVAERLNPGTYKDLLRNIEGDSAQIEVVREMFATSLGVQENKKDDEPNNPLLEPLFLHQLSLIEEKKVFETNASLVRNINNVLGTIYGHIVINRNHFPMNDKGMYDNFCNNTYTAFTKLIQDTTALRKIDIEQFNKLLQAIPEVVNYDTLKLAKIADLLSPYDLKTKKVFDILYPKDKVVKQNWNENITHNAGYYQLANLYALSNNFSALNQSFDSLLKYNKNILNTYYGYGYPRFLYDLVITNKLITQQGIDFVAKIESKLVVKRNYSLSLMMLNNLLSDKSDVDQWTIQEFAKEQYGEGWRVQLQREHITYKQLNALTDGIIAQTITSDRLKEDEKNYIIALLYKAKAFANNKKENYNVTEITQSFKKAITYYKKTTSDYLKGDITIGDGNNVNTVSRNKLFLHAIQVSLGETYQPFSIFDWRLQTFKNKSAFIDFLTKEKVLQDFYFKTDAEAMVLNNFLLSYYSSYKFNNVDEKTIDLMPFLEALTENKLPKKIDKNAMLAFLTCYSHSKNQDILALKYAKQIDLKTFLNKEKIKTLDNEEQYYNLSKSLLNYYWNQPFKPFATDEEFESGTFKKQTQGFDKGFDFLKTFPDEYQKRNALIINIDSLQRSKKDAITMALMDSLINIHILKSSKFGNKLFEILGRLSTSSGDNMAMVLMKDKPDKAKPSCLNYFVKGKAQARQYYQATTFIPDYVSSSSQLSLYTTILKQEVIKRKNKAFDGWYNADDQSIDNNWGTGAYEESGIIYYSSEE